MPEIPCLRNTGAQELSQSDTCITAEHDGLHSCCCTDESVHNTNTYNDASKKDPSGIPEWHEPIAGPCGAHLAAGRGTNLKCSVANINRNRTEVHDWPHPTLLHDIKCGFETKPRHTKRILRHSHPHLTIQHPVAETGYAQ